MDPRAQSERVVLALSQAFPPVLASGSFRTLRFVKHLPECGWRPVVLTERPERFGSRPLDAALGRQIPAEAVIERTRLFWPPQRLRGILLRSTPRAVLRSSADGDTRLSRVRQSLLRVGKLAVDLPDSQAAWLAMAMYRTLTLVAKHRPSVIYSSSPPESSHLVGLFAKRLTGLPLVLDFRDPWASARRSPSGQSPGAWLSAGLEAWCVDAADRLVLNTPRLLQDFRTRYPAAIHDRLTVITNGYDPELLPTVEGWLRRGRHPDAVVRICHVGSVYPPRTLVPLAHAVKKLVADGLRVQLEHVGYVPASDIPHGEHVNIISTPVPHERALERMAVADILVCLSVHSIFQVPAKLYEMLMFRKPILALAHPGATFDMISRFRLGMVADPTDPARIAHALRSLVARRSEISASEGWALALAEFNGRALSQQLGRVLDDACGAGSR